MSANESRADIDRIMSFIWGDGLHYGTFTQPRRLKTTVQFMEDLDEAWRLQDTKIGNVYTGWRKSTLAAGEAPIPVFRYFGAKDGTFRVFPGIQLQKGYDPTQRGWYKL